ncbi:unnamed protein product [Lampetra fluviatilis]
MKPSQVTAGRASLVRGGRSRARAAAAGAAAAGGGGVGAHRVRSGKKEAESPLLASPPALASPRSLAEGSPRLRRRSERLLRLRLLLLPLLFLLLLLPPRLRAASTSRLHFRHLNQGRVTWPR